MGGGAMRAAAKLTGVTVANGSFRGVTSEHFPVPFSAVRRASSVRPAGALVSPAEDVKLVAQSQSEACVEVDDWVFAGDEGELVMSGGKPMPRVVFSGAPSIQEAKEATSELSVALGKAYLSPPHSNTEFEETKTSGLSEIGMAPAAPLHAVKAFRLLHESSVAQNVVASIACDPNVWNAVLQNPELQEFLNSQNSYVMDSDMEGSFHDSSDKSESDPGIGFTGFFQKIKVSVVDMMSSLSDYFRSFFGGQGGAKVIANEDGTARITAENVMEASFMGLAVMAIMVILLKRA